MAAQVSPNPQPPACASWGSAPRGRRSSRSGLERRPPDFEGHTAEVQDARVFFFFFFRRTGETTLKVKNVELL